MFVAQVKLCMVHKCIRMYVLYDPSSVTMKLCMHINICTYVCVYVHTYVFKNI